jgi:hypothetical protein
MEALRRSVEEAQRSRGRPAEGKRTTKKAAPKKAGTKRKPAKQPG